MVFCPSKPSFICLSIDAFENISTPLNPPLYICYAISNNVHRLYFKTGNLDLFWPYVFRSKYALYNTLGSS